MRSYFCFLLACIIILAAGDLYAQSAHSGINISTSDQSVIQIGMNNKIYHKKNSQFKLRNIPKGKHRIKIYRPLGKNQKGVLYDFRLKVQPDKLYNITLYMPQRTFEIQTIDLLADNRHSSQASPRRESANTQSIDRIIDSDKNRAQTIRESFHQEEGAIDAESKRNYSETYSGSLSQDKLNALIQKLDATKPSQEQINTISQTLKNETYTTKQIIQILTHLKHDSQKMAVIKSSFSNAVDQHNYNQLESQLLFDSSKEELKNFLR